MGQRMTKCVFCVLCNFVFFYHEYKKKIVNHIVYFCTFWPPRVDVQEGNTEDLFTQPMCFVCFLFHSKIKVGLCLMCFCIFWVYFFVFFGFCCKRVVRPKQNRGNPLCILRVFVFFFSFKRTDEQGMCFVCFCVFSSDHRTHNQRPPCVFVFFVCL